MASRGTLLLVGGASSDALLSAMSRRFADEGYRVVRAIGELPDEPTEVLGVVGFGAGGPVALRASADDARVAAVLLYSPAALPDAVIARLRVPVLAFYGSDDRERLAGLDAVADALDATGIEFVPQLYRGAGGDFFDEGSTGYDENAAEDAWATANAFLARELASARAARG